jgi:hypothetical protein
MTTVAQATPSSATQKSSTGLVLLICAAFLAINLITGTRNPRVYQDEVMFSDPAINLVRGHGFKTTAWPYQTSQQIFASNAPMYSLVLAGWFEIVGVSLLKARSLNYALMMAAGVLIVVACRRTNLVRGRLGTGLLLAMFFCAYGPVFSYRYARYDVLGILLCALLCWEGTLGRPRLRRTLLLVTAALLPATGMRLLPYAAIMGLILLATWGRKLLADLVCVGLGCVIGAAALFGFFAHEGVLHTFFGAVRAQSTPQKNLAGPTIFRPGLAVPFAKTFQTSGATDEAVPSRFQSVMRAEVEHRPNLIVAIGLAALAAAWPPLRRAGFYRRILFAGIAAALLIPLVMASLGRFEIYCAWMGFVPAAIALAFCLDRLSEAHAVGLVSRTPIWLGAVVALLCCYGLPGRLTLAALQWKQNDPAPMERFVVSVVSPNDVVMSSYPGYFGVRRTNAPVFLTIFEPAMTPQEFASVSLAILNPIEMTQSAPLLGGSWEAVGEYWPSGVTDNSSYPLGPAWYHLVAYRRAGGP